MRVQGLRKASFSQRLLDGRYPKGGGCPSETTPWPTVSGLASKSHHIEDEPLCESTGCWCALASPWASTCEQAAMENASTSVTSRKRGAPSGSLGFGRGGAHPRMGLGTGVVAVDSAVTRYFSPQGRYDDASGIAPEALRPPTKAPERHKGDTGGIARSWVLAAPAKDHPVRWLM